jgi:hypothetical protein
LTSGNSFAFDFEQFARLEVLRCVHPTVDFQKATVALIGKPSHEEGGITRGKVKLDYRGWLRNNSMTIEISLKAGSPRMVRVAILNDSSGTNKVDCIIQSCAYIEGWQEIPE